MSADDTSAGPPATPPAEGGGPRVGPGPAGTPDSSRHGAGFWAAFVVGVATMAWGVHLYLGATPDLRRRLDWGEWIVGADLAHDLLVAPVVLLVGAIVARLVPGRWRAPVQAGLFVTAVVLVLAWLPLHGTAGDANPTVQPLDYATATLAVLGAVWVGVASWLAVVALRGRGGRTGDGATPGP